MDIQFTVDGEPKPRQSVRFAVRNTKRGHIAIAYHKKNDKVAYWLERVYFEAQRHKPATLSEEAIEITVIFYRTKPKSWPKKKIFPITNPDCENLIKPVVDVLEGMYLKNDAQVCTLIVHKRLSDRPGMQIRIKNIGEDNLIVKGFPLWNLSSDNQKN